MFGLSFDALWNVELDLIFSTAVHSLSIRLSSFLLQSTLVTLRHCLKRPESSRGSPSARDARTGATRCRQSPPHQEADNCPLASLVPLFGAGCNVLFRLSSCETSCRLGGGDDS